MGLLASVMLSAIDTGQAWALALEAGAREGVPPALLMAVMERESGFNPDPPHRAGDGYGLMQVLPETAGGVLGYAVSIADLIDPRANVGIGARYLAQQLRRYGGRVADAVAAYNAGTARKNAAGLYVNTQGVPNVQGYVEGVLASYGRWLGAVPPAIVATVRTWSSLLSNPWALGAGALVSLGLLLVVLRPGR